MAASDARPIPRKNVAYRITVPIFDADGDLVGGLTGLDSEVSKDGGTFADCTNEATEIATNSGMVYLDLTATEMNADTVAILIKCSNSGAKTTPIVLYPEEAGDIRVNVTQWKDATAPDNTGDAYAIVNNGTYGNSAIETLVDDLEGRLTAARAGYLDNLSAGAVAQASELAKVPKSDGASTWNATALAAMATQAQTGLTAQGYTTTRAGYLDTLNGLVAAIWNALTSGIATTGSIGKLIKDYLDAAVSSRSTYAGGDTSGVTTLLSRIVGTLAAGTHNPQSGDTFARLGANGAGLTALPWSVAWDAEIQSEVQDAIEANHLDHLLAAAYDPASKPGNASALLNVMVENDGGVPRYTANSLELAPTGGSAPTAAQIADAVLEEIVSEHVAVDGSLADVVSDMSSNQVDLALSFGLFAEIMGSMLEETETPHVYRYTSDALAEAPTGGGSAPTAAQIREEMDANSTMLAAILDDTGNAGVVVAAGSKTGYALSSAGITAIWAEVMEGSISALQAMRLFMAVLLGKSSSGGTVFRDTGDSKNRLAFTIDEDGNRTAVIRDGS